MEQFRNEHSSQQKVYSVPNLKIMHVVFIFYYYLSS